VAPETGDEYFIDNAGLAIVSPFLRPFFHDLGLLTADKKGFRDEARQVRAIHLTQFLVTWEAGPDEFDLLFNKLLCGWPPEKPVDREIGITPEMEQRARTLLESVVKTWSALKRTSPEGFRTTFFRREGIFRFDGAMWRLTIQRTAVDVLLETVPWAFSIIKQPWMPAPVMVQW
jgi:hypothetical protein